MKAIKLTPEQYRRSLNSKSDHLWVYNKNINFGSPQFCIVLDNDKNICDFELSKLFGEGHFMDGSVSPNDKSQMFYDVFYIKK
jgi:hypothetical protein